MHASWTGRGPGPSWQISSCACMGAEFLRRLAEKEHEHGIPVDADVDAFLQACTVEGKASHPLTNFFLRILGLEVRLPLRLALVWGSLLPASCVSQSAALCRPGCAAASCKIGIMPCAAP